MAGQPSVEDMSRGLMDPFNYLRRARNRDGVCRKDVWGTLLSDGMKPHDRHGRPTEFLRMLYQRDTARLA